MIPQVKERQARQAKINQPQSKSLNKEIIPDSEKGQARDKAAKLFPLMSGDELRELAENIGKHGLVHPIVLHMGAILDGRNRLIACKMADVLPEFEDWTVCGSPTEWVLSVNLHRRHLTPSQKGFVAKDALPLFEKEAEERKAQSNANREKIPPSEKGKATEKAAKAVGVNPRYVSDAKAIEKASPEIAQKVRSGEMSIPEANRKFERVNFSERVYRSPKGGQKKEAGSFYLLGRSGKKKKPTLKLTTPRRLDYHLAQPIRLAKSGAVDRADNQNLLVLPQPHTVNPAKTLAAR